MIRVLMVNSDEKAKELEALLNGDWKFIPGSVFPYQGGVVVTLVKQSIEKANLQVPHAGARPANPRR